MRRTIRQNKSQNKNIAANYSITLSISKSYKNSTQFKSSTWLSYRILKLCCSDLLKSNVTHGLQNAMLHSQEVTMNRLTIENLKHIVAVTKDESLKLKALIELQRREDLINQRGQ